MCVANSVKYRKWASPQPTQQPEKPSTVGVLLSHGKNLLLTAVTRMVLPSNGDFAPASTIPEGISISRPCCSKWLRDIGLPFTQYPGLLISDAVARESVVMGMPSRPFDSCTFGIFPRDTKETREQFKTFKFSQSLCWCFTIV